MKAETTELPWADVAATGLNPGALGRPSERVRSDVRESRYFAGSVVAARGGTFGYREVVG